MSSSYYFILSLRYCCLLRAWCTQYIFRPLEGRNFEALKMRIMPLLIWDYWWFFCDSLLLHFHTMHISFPRRQKFQHLHFFNNAFYCMDNWEFFSDLISSLFFAVCITFPRRQKFWPCQIMNFTRESLAYLLISDSFDSVKFFHRVHFVP